MPMTVFPNPGCRTNPPQNNCLCMYNVGILLPCLNNCNKDYVDPARLITMLSDKMEEDGIYVADVGQNQIWSCGYHSPDPHHSGYYRYSVLFGKFP